jgi:hypothetical protein
VRDYLAKLREVDLTFENGAAVVEKYRSKYPELSNHIRRIVPDERVIEITQNLGDDADLRLHLFAIRILDDDALYEVTLSAEKEAQAVKSSEWLSTLHDTLARLIAQDYLRPGSARVTVFAAGEVHRRACRSCWSRANCNHLSIPARSRDVLVHAVLAPEGHQTL